MKRKFNRLISVLLVLLMFFSAVPANVFAFEADMPEFTPDTITDPILPEGFSLTGRTELDENGNTIWEAETQASEYGLVNVIWVDAYGDKVQNPDAPLAYPVNKDGVPVVKGETLPSDYDARDYGLITPVEYQVGGTCWAHAATACVETAYLKNFGTTYDLSEYHAAWFAKNSYYEGVTDSANDGLSKADIVSGVLDAGGNMPEYCRAVVNFSGAVLESRYPLNTEDNSSRVGTSQLAEDMKNTFTYETRYQQDAILEGIRSIPYDISALKQAVLDYGAVMVLYYSDDAYYTDYWNAGDEPVAYYHPSATDTNHAVTLIGWDDNFSRENFGTYKPQNDGAWLIKNSWSTRWGNDGYFWISYEDAAIQLYDSYVVMVGDPDEYEDIYLHNGFDNVSNTNAYTKSANIFTARNDIYLSKISYGGATTNKDYTLKIYKGLSENCTDPTAGTLVYTQSGKTYGGEYIAVNGDVKINKGERFSVVFEFDRFYYEGTIATTCKAGDSFYYNTSAGEWVDTAGSNYSNVCIRAIAKYQEDNDSYKITYKDGAHYSETATSSGGTVALPQKAGHTYVLTYNNSEFTGTGITQDCVVNMHCYPTNGETSENNACTTVYECIYCGEKMKEDYVSHSYKSEVLAATAKNIGYTMNLCTVCGEHTYSDINIHSDATGGQTDSFWWQYMDGNLCVFSAAECAMPDYTGSSATPWAAHLDDITTLTVNDKITYLGDYAFSSLPALSELNLPDSITEIGDYCFSGAKALKIFDCPDALTKIGTYAFNGAVSLEDINYNDAIKTIGSYAYMGCSSLTEVVLPGTLTSIGDYLFYNCPNVTKITAEEGVTRLRYQLWCQYGNSKLEEIVIPSTATSVTFMNYAHLDKYTISPDNKVYCSVDGVVFSKDMTKLLAYPATKADKYYKVPASVVEMDYYVFSYINGLKYLDMSECSIKIIKDKAFNQTKTLTNVNLPKTTTNIWYQAFYRTRIENIFVPASVTSYQDPPFTTGGSSSYFIPNFYTDSETAKIKEFADEYGYTCTVLHTDHDFSTAVADMSKEPTCKDEGKSFKICACGSFEYKTVPATGAHSLVKGETIAPTCTEDGYTVYTCSACGTTVNKDNVTAPGHKFEWIIDSDATCGVAGKKHEKCNVCGAVQSEDTEIPATGEHNYTSEITAEPTCEIKGVRTYTCSNCGDSYTEEIAATGHDYKSTVTPPTCEEKGYTTYICTCGDTYKDNYVDALGHDYKWIVDSDATCGKAGEKHEECTRCDATRNLNTAIPATGEHSYESEITVPATHLKEGVKTYTCGGCGDSYTEPVAKLKDHDYKSKVTAPTCNDKGYTTYTCVCGDTYKDNYVDALGHNYKWIIDREATCGTAGEKHEECTRCYGTRSLNTAIPATGEHSYTSKVTVEPICETKGERTYICSGCGDSYTEEIAATGHDYKSTVTPPTCEEKGYTTYTCACGKSYIDDYVNETGHKYAPAVTAPATHLTEGVMTYTCTCGDSYTDIIPKIKDHTYTEEITVQPTHLAEGEKTFTCPCGDSYTETIAKTPEHKYTSTVVKAATHLEYGKMKYTCECGDSYEKDIAKTPDHTYKVTGTKAPTCNDKGYTTYTCACGKSYNDNYVNARGHDFGSDGVCKSCGYNKVKDCSCNCHKTGFGGFIWKILRFFYKLFKINPVCACGAKHY